MLDKIKIFSIYKYLNSELKVKVIIFAFFSVITSFLDVLSIGAVFPLLSSLIDSSSLIKNESIIFFFNLLNITVSKDTIVRNLLIIFILFLLISTLTKIFLVNYIIKTQNTISVYLSKQIFNQTINQEFVFFSKLDSNKLTTVLTQKINSVSLTVQSILTSISNFINVIFIFFGLLYLNFKITLILTTVFSTFYFFINFVIKKKVLKNSEIASKTSDNVLKVIKETLGSIRYYIIRDRTEFIGKVFESNFQRLKKIQIYLARINLIPRYLIETILLIVLSLIVVLSGSGQKSFLVEIPLLGTFILASQRMLPNINLLFINLNNIMANFSQVNDVIEFLSYKDGKKIDNLKNNIKFTKKITFHNINFSYQLTNRNEKVDVIKNLNFEILKGEKIGIIGKSGSGKSTLLDIVMGLLNPTNGKITCDNTIINNENIKAWRRKFSHVPQKIFLVKDTIKKNIAFSERSDVINQQLTDLAVKVSGLNFIETLPNKIDSDIGEDGSLLSGGQRQRVGIARSIYDNTEILTFDEATSAIDSNLRQEIFDNLDKYLSDKTFIAITHDSNQLSFFDKIIHLKENFEYEIK